MLWIWDPAKDWINRHKHGIGFDTASLVFHDPLSVTKPDDFYPGELRLHTIGMVGGVVLLVLHTQPEYDVGCGMEVGRIIGARKATRHERRNYAEGIF